MINTRMGNYEFYTYGEPNEYGQAVLSEEIKGTIKISISNISTATSDNIKYKDADYIGLTMAQIDDTYVIQYGEEKLKVRYVIPGGKYKQVFMSAL